MFLKDFGFFSAVLVPFYTQWAHISLFQVQVLQSWFMVCLFLLDVPMGMVADRFGRKYVLVAGVALDAVASFLYGSTPYFDMFILGEFLMALSLSLISGADNALLYDALVEEGKEGQIKQKSSRSQAINYLGVLIAAPLGSLIAAHFGLNVPMLATAVPLLLAALVAWSIAEPKIHRETLKRGNPFQAVKKGIIFFYQHPKLRLLGLDGIFVATSAYFITWIYQPLLLQIHTPIFLFGFIIPILVGSEILVAHFFPRLEKLFGSSKRYLTISAGLTGVAFLLVGIFPNMITILLFLIFAGGFGFTRMDLMISYMNPFIPSENRATVLSTISMTRRFFLIFLNPLVGLLADHSLQVVAILLGTLPLLMFFFSPVEHAMFENTKEPIPEV